MVMAAAFPYQAVKTPCMTPALHTLSHLILETILHRRRCFPHVIGEESRIWGS